LNTLEPFPLVKNNSLFRILGKQEKYREFFDLGDCTIRPSSREVVARSHVPVGSIVSVPLARRERQSGGVIYSVLVLENHSRGLPLLRGFKRSIQLVVSMAQKSFAVRAAID